MIVKCGLEHVVIAYVRQNVQLMKTYAFKSENARRHVS